MPCRCCGASRPSKGFNHPDEKLINDLLKEASRLILKKEEDFDDITEWKEAWKEAFDHHLNGCKEKI
jgi:hypothetical protein